VTEASPLIAVVDDEETVRRVIARFLEASGYAVESFESGESFLRSLAGRRPDCLILDLHMPRLDDEATG
jgi:two-component system response regulator FixJ